MIKTARQLKDLIRNLSKKNAADAQILMRNYMMERFLERISLSSYRDKFILKGGMLVAAMVGLDARSTMDLDATVKGANVSVEDVENMMAEIIAVPIDDGVTIRLNFPAPTEERRKQLAGTMSGGEQQMLAMGRALMSNASMLMLDEPSMGLSPLLVQEIFDIIRDIHKEGMTILLVEQNAQMALSVADRAYVLETGRVVMDGTGAELLTNERVRSAYLGG